MKFAKILLLSVPLLLVFFSSCDKINTFVGAIKHGNIKDTVLDMDTVVPLKRILLEDYTGHYCVNCPTATKLAQTLAGTYIGKLIVLGVHAGYNARLPVPDSGEFAADFRSTAGENWNIDFGINDIDPQGMVNRLTFNGKRVLSKDAWSNAVSGIISEEPAALMVMVNSYNASERTVTSTIYTQFLTALSGGYTLTVCIVEDSLISAQSNNNSIVGTVPVIHNYVFMDVLREAVNGSYGEALTNSVNTGTTYMGTYNISLKESWVPKNCSVLAFVSKSDDTKEIIQVLKKKVIPE